MKKLLIAVLVITSVFAAGQGNMMPSFSDFDLNKDGQITKVEFNDAHQKRMQSKADDGRMMRNVGNAPSFSDMDTDANGLIGSEEFKIHQLTNRRGSGKGMRFGQGMGR